MPQEQAPNNKPTPKTFFRKRDLILIAAVLALAAGFFVYRRFTATTGTAAQITVGLISQEQTIALYNLDQDRSIEITNASLPVHLEVKGGKIRFVGSECPDHDCEGFGWLRNEGDWAACLPAGVVVRIVEE